MAAGRLHPGDARAPSVRLRSHIGCKSMQTYNFSALWNRSVLHVETHCKSKSEFVNDFWHEPPGAGMQQPAHKSSCYLSQLIKFTHAHARGRSNLTMTCTLGSLQSQRQLHSCASGMIRPFSRHLAQPIQAAGLGSVLGHATGRSNVAFGEVTCSQVLQAWHMTLDTNSSGSYRAMIKGTQSLNDNHLALCMGGKSDPDKA